MPPWKNTDKQEYRNLDLRAHALLKDVPLYDVWQVDLPGGGEGRTVSDILALAKSSEPSGVVKALFGLRWFLGRIFRWDAEPPDKEALFRARLSAGDIAKSGIAPGSKQGPFTILYVFPQEAMSEIRNKTVHAALVWVLVPKGEGYRLLWGIYVRQTGWLTPIYMGLIKPFRHWIVYPALFRRLYLSWQKVYNGVS